MGCLTNVGLFSVRSSSKPTTRAMSQLRRYAPVGGAAVGSIAILAQILNHASQNSTLVL